MKIFPAIDVRNGRVTRLCEGKFDSAVNYDTSPLEAALDFQNSGAQFLHMVDLDGAKNGEPRNFEIVSSVFKETKLFVEIGGGIRNVNNVEKYLSAGAGRCILGTAAVNDETFLREALKLFGDKIAVGVDARNGQVAVSGWTDTTEISSLDFCKKLKDMGVACIIYTDISKDGMLSGPNFEIYRELKKINGLEIVASGGVTTVNDVAVLKETGVDAAIIGKALYEGKINLKEVLNL